MFLLPGSNVTSLILAPYSGGINDDGLIAASGTIDGHRHALILTPTNIPEPGSALLLMYGLAGMTFACRFRINRNA